MCSWESLFIMARLKQTYTTCKKKNSLLLKKIPVNFCDQYTRSHFPVYVYFLHKTVKFDCDYTLFRGRECRCLI